MGKPGDQAPEIPGFQPLHIRGAGRLGIWIEARQVRLDRRVLLKVLPAAESDLQQEFIREVQALVQLDGAGALRVIDEGAAGRARYVALDEGEAIALDSAPQELDQKLDLGRSLLDLYQRLSQLKIVAGPIPTSALRILPSGGFVVSELGAVAEEGSEQEIRERAALTLESVGLAFGISSPWTEAIRALRNDTDGFSRAREVFDQHLPMVDRIRSRMLLVVGLIAMVCFGFFWPRLWRGTEEINEGDQSSSVVTSTEVEKEEGTAEEPSNPQQGNVDPETQNLEKPGGSEELADLRFQQHQKIQTEESARAVWAPFRDQILADLAEGNLSAARLNISKLSLEREASKDAATVTAEKDALILAWKWVEQRKVAVARVSVESAEAEDDYEKAISTLKALAHELGLQQQFGPEIETLESRGRLFKETLDHLQEEMERVLISLRDLASTEMSAPAGLSSFPRLQKRWVSFRDSCDSVGKEARSIIASVEAQVDSGVVRQWSLKGGKAFDARATAVDEKSVSLRKVGRRTPEVHPWSVISGEVLLLLAKDFDHQVLDEDQFLSRCSLVWGDDETLLEISRSELVEEEISLAADRLRRKQVDRWIQDGRKIEVDRNWKLLRERAIEIARWVDEDQRPEIEEQLVSWWSALVEDEGPQSIGLFPQAEVSHWDPETGAVEVLWRGNDTGLVGWQSSPGSTISRRGEFALVQGRVFLGGPVRFADTLEVQLTGLVTREDAPNLNVVLWSGTPEALLFGVGIRPPELSSIRVGDIDVLLPAHMIIEEELFAEGGGDFLMPAPRPKVLPGKAARLVVGEDETGARLDVDGAVILKTEGRSGPRIGSLAIETFGVPVVIREVIVRTRLFQQDWYKLLREKAQEELWKTR